MLRGQRIWGRLLAVEKGGRRSEFLVGEGLVVFGLQLRAPWIRFRMIERIPQNCRLESKTEVLLVLIVCVLIELVY